MNPTTEAGALYFLVLCKNYNSVNGILVWIYNNIIICQGIAIYWGSINACVICMF